MRKIQALVLCLVAAFALSAFAASGASAATYNTCQKVAKKKGKYANATCTTKKEKNGKPDGNFEITSIPLEANSGVATLETPGGTVSTFAGSPGVAGSSDGLNALFNSPQAVAALRKRVSNRPLVYFDFRTSITNHYGSAPKPRRRRRKR